MNDSLPPQRRAAPARRTPALAVLAAATLAAVLAACSPKPDGPPGGMPAGMGAMPPPPVGVMTVQLGAVPIGAELPGRLEAWRSAQVRARVPGIVQKRAFVEGSLVKPGQVLFELDADAARASVASAQAQAARADASVEHAKAQAERNRPLADARAISQQEWLATQTALKQAEAEAAAARAAIASARVPLAQSRIVAPIGGRIGRAQVTEGALVGPADPTPMAVIQQLHPLYVNFTQSAADVLRLSRAVDAGQLKRSGNGVAVRIVLEDGSEYPLPAKLLFADPTVDAGTGQVSLRAEVPNPNNVLLPGLFVRVRLVEAVSEQAARIPQQAVTRGSAADSVLVVGADNKPEPRVVKIGGAAGGDWVVLSGLKNGDRVIVDGFQKMRPGAPVTPVPWAPPASAPRNGAAAANTPPNTAARPVGPAPSASSPASAPNGSSTVSNATVPASAASR